MRTVSQLMLGTSRWSPWITPLLMVKSQWIQQTMHKTMDKPSQRLMYPLYR